MLCMYIITVVQTLKEDQVLCDVLLTFDFGLTFIDIYFYEQGIAL